MDFIGREQELNNLNELYSIDKFQLFILYGRRRIGKTTLLNEFCKDKDSIFYSAEQSNDKLNIEKFSECVFRFYGENTLEPFSSWSNALSYIDERQKEKRIVLVIDEFPYLAMKNNAIMSEFQHIIDHKLKDGKLFIVLCGSYMGFMEKEVLGAKSPLFGRRTGQMHMKSFDYRTSLYFLDGFSDNEKLMLYGAFGGTPLYLAQINRNESFEENINKRYLSTTAYLYEEPMLLLRQEVQEPGIYSAIIEAIAKGATKANTISTKIGEESAKCIKYINVMCELGLLYKETPFGEKSSSRRTIYGICDLMFRFWYRYVYANRTLIETGASQVVWQRCILPDYSAYMGHVFEKICREWMLRQNASGQLPILFTSIGRWWGANPYSKEHEQIEIDIVASNGKDYIFGECKWRSETCDVSVLAELQRKADVFYKDRQETFFILFSKSGFTDSLKKIAITDKTVILVGTESIVGI